MGHCRTTSISLTRAMLTHLPRHRKSDPLRRKHRIRPTPAFSRFPPIRSLTLEGQLWVDIVEKLEFLRRSQFRGPPEASTEYSLGVRLSDRSCHVRRSNRRCCGNYRRRQHYMRSSEIFAAPQFPSFSTVSAHSRRQPCVIFARQQSPEAVTTTEAIGL